MNARRIVWSIVGLLSLSAAASEPVQILVPSDAASGYGEGFGKSVAISGDWLVVGAPEDDELAEDAGAAYIFRRVGAQWIEHQKITGYPLREDYYGRAVAIDGDRIVVGAPHDVFMTGGIGKAFIYHREDYGVPGTSSDDWWSTAAHLHPPPSQLCCNFGGSLAIDVDVVVVGSIDYEYSLGHAYVFRWDGIEWRGPETLVGSDTEAGDKFGASVAVRDSLIAVGASWDDDLGTRAGSAYVFAHKGGAWTQEAKLVASDGSPGDLFGSAVLFSDEGVVIGAPGNDDVGFESGSTYVFAEVNGTWQESENLLPSDVDYYDDRFGTFIAAHKNILLISAGGDTWAYIFQRNNAGWVRTDALPKSGEFIVPPVALDGRFALVADHLYAVGQSLSLTDFALFQNCIGKAAGAIPPSCGSFDLEPDDRIDARDLPLFLLRFRGP